MSTTKGRAAKKEQAIEYLGGKCWKCEKTFERECYDFHHLVPATKKYDWNKMQRREWSIIQKELDKCILLCSNCHRIAHKEMREHANI